MYIFRFFGKRGALTDTETVLFVRDDKPAVGKHDIIFQKCMRSDDKRQCAVCKTCLDCGLFLCFCTADKQGAVIAECLKQRSQIFIVLGC